MDGGGKIRKGREAVRGRGRDPKRATCLSRLGTLLRQVGQAFSLPMGLMPYQFPALVPDRSGVVYDLARLLVDIAHAFHQPARRVSQIARAV